MHIIKSGDSKATLSMNLGSEMMNPQIKKPERKELKKSREKPILYGIDLKTYDVEDHFDFLILGSIFALNIGRRRII